jgi:hypothetical protein
MVLRHAGQTHRRVEVLAIRDTDIDAYVCHAKLLHDCTRAYRFSKELLAFLQTLVAFCPYYVGNDPNTAGPMDIYYAEGLRDCAAVTY